LEAGLCGRIGADRMESDWTFPEALVKHVGRSPYDQSSQLYEVIKQNRDGLGGTLFYDVLLKDLCGIEDRLYPPRNLQSVLSLIRRIESNVDTKQIRQACLIYYLFLDFGELKLQEDIAAYYADQLNIPRGHLELIQGLWCLDRLKYEEAMLHLGHPETLPEYHDRIIAAFIKHSTSPMKYQQVMTYINAKCPRLMSEDTVGYYVETLCSVSLYSALRFSRTSSPNIRLALFEKIVDSALTINPKENLWRLANLPLNEEEATLLRKVLENIISSGDDHASVVKDVLLMRNLHGGDLLQARRVTSLGNSSAFDTTSQVTWSDISRGLALAEGPSNPE
jgi:hypothetical protein